MSATCPFCAEEIADQATKCKHCGESLAVAHGGAAKSGKGCGPSPGCLVFGIVSIVVVGAIAIPNLIEARRGGEPEIGALRTIGSAQSLFREADKEGDGNLDYGTLRELGRAGRIGLIDEVLASGTKHGYLFEATYGRTTSEFLWMATATPRLPGPAYRYFVTNHEGVIFYTLSAPFRVNSVDCTIPAGARPIYRR